MAFAGPDRRGGRTDLSESVFYKYAIAAAHRPFGLFLIYKLKHEKYELGGSKNGKFLKSEKGSF